MIAVGQGASYEGRMIQATLDSDLVAIGELLQRTVPWRWTLWLGDHRPELNHAGPTREFGRTP